MKVKGSFSEKVYQIVRRIPLGKVATYGWVAAKLGSPRAFRAVGNALHKNLSSDVPCHRVVGKDGKLAVNYRFAGWKEQKKKLLKEGIKFKDKMHVDLKKFLLTDV